MDNASRSERTRNAALEAALTIIARDGPGRLTLDAIAKEAGISKGGLMHQFPSKLAVMKALLERQVEHFEGFARAYLSELGPDADQPELLTAIATLREAAMQPQPIAVAFLAALAEEPSLLSLSRERDAERVAAIKAEARDPDLAMLRRAAAQGLALSAIFGLTLMPKAEMARLFDRLMGDVHWPALGKPRKPAKRIGNKQKS
jgi:AcrR family transcriptional regulator